MAWVFLVLAILAETAGTVNMKLAEGFTKPGPLVMVAVFYTISIGFLILALKRLDISVAYAVWSGVGTAFIAAVGILWFQEPVTAIKLLSLALIVVGVVGLNLAGAH